MSMPDYLLVGWWLLFASTVLAWFGLARWRKNAEQKSAALACLNGDKPDLYRSMTAGLPRSLNIAGIAVAVMVLVLMAGFGVLLWMSHWTRLLVHQGQLWVAVFGVICLFASRVVTSTRIPHIRPISAIFGVLGVGVGLYWVIGDLAYPRLVVEGQIERVAQLRTLRGDSFAIVIDGRRHEATREAYLLAEPGERARAELGAASKIIFQLEMTRDFATTPLRSVRPPT